MDAPLRRKILSHFKADALTGVAYKDHSRRKGIISRLSGMEEITINEISESLNISVPKATELLADLAKVGFVKERGKRSEGPGRKATYYGLAADSCYFIGIEIKKYKLNIGLMGFNKTIEKASFDIPFFLEDANASLNEIVKQVRQFINECGVPTGKIVGIGVSISGRINVRTGEILTIYHFSDAPVKKTLEAEFGMPVFLDNDSRTLAYGEFHFGKRQQESEVLVLNLDYGMALGIFVNSKPVYGASGYAGELGHIPLFENEKICFCGKKGCMETVASGAALIDWILLHMKGGSNSVLAKVLEEKGIIELQDVVEAVKKGDNLAIQGIGNIAGNIGRGLAVTINLLNPQLIILSGVLSEVGESLLLPIKTSIIEHSLTLVSSDTKVVLSGLNEKAGLLGACLLVRDKIVGLVES
ncbi:MAG TPA: ROK family transcriptional regulator [Phnomibacter sp.]|nr:ROK family transcriptional regulator [Phnomibacter sp.]